MPMPSEKPIDGEERTRKHFLPASVGNIPQSMISVKAHTPVHALVGKMPMKSVKAHTPVHALVGKMPKLTIRVCPKQKPRMAKPNDKGGSTISVTQENKKTIMAKD
jgi:hypothetical protein